MLLVLLYVVGCTVGSALGMIVGLSDLLQAIVACLAGWAAVTTVIHPLELHGLVYGKDEDADEDGEVQ